MTILTGGAAVIDDSPTQIEGSRSFRVPVSKAMGARDILQAISRYSSGPAPARRNPVGEEVLYVARGEGVCHLDGHRYPLRPGVAVYIPPGSVFQIENTERKEESKILEVVSVCCPQDDRTEIGVPLAEPDPNDTMPFRTVHEDQQTAIPAGDRTFKLLVNKSLGCNRVTQFVGTIPPGRAPMHHHSYEEAIYILDGHGCVWTDDGHADFKPGSSIYLPRGVSHCLENTGRLNVKLLGVFHPSGSPGEAYQD